MFPIEIWWIFCHHAFEVIAEHTVQRNTHLGHHLPSLCCHLHCALLTLHFSKEQQPTPPINASLGLILTVSRGGEHASRLFSHNSHTETFTTEEILLRSLNPPPFFLKQDQSAPTSLFICWGLSVICSCDCLTLQCCFQSRQLPWKH